MNPLRALAPTLALALTAGLASAQNPTFARTDLAGYGINHVVADFNGDGRKDLAGQGGPGFMAVQLGNGDGTFQPRTLVPIFDAVHDLAAGDFDGDGKTDLAVTINEPDIGFAFFGGNGDGTFRAPAYLPNSWGLDSPAIVAADLDDDGKLDVVIGHNMGCYVNACVVARTITVMRGNGDGTFQPPADIDIGTTTSQIAVSDFDRDGIDDLAIASDSAKVVVLLGNGDGTFVQQPTMIVVPDPGFVVVSDIDAADVNGDGLVDLVAAAGTNGSKTAVIFGNGDGTFRLPPLLLVDPNLSVPQYQEVADYNGDGAPDLALCVGNGTWGLIQIRNGNGAGGFGAPAFYQVPPPLSSIGCVGLVASDLNNDGKPDLNISIGGAASGLAVLRNTTGTAPPPVPGAPSLVSPADDASVPQPVALDWSSVSNAASYEVQVDDSSSFTQPLVANPVVGVSQVTVGGGLVAGQRYYWRVRARNSAGAAGPFSSIRRFRPQSTPVPPSPATLSSVTMTPSSVTGGSASTGRVTLSSGAPSGGAVVALSSGNTAVATVPASVTVAAGATSATFPATTAAVSTSAPVTVTAAYNGVARTATLTVTPPGQAATLTVTASGRSGERVLSSPSGINVAVGSTGSASFAAGTSITLSVTNGRDAFWSGACSSGGNKTRTCTFTLNGSAAVSANVQ